jgi:hypothetical protein
MRIVYCVFKWHGLQIWSLELVASGGMCMWYPGSRDAHYVLRGEEAIFQTLKSPPPMWCMR